jgi:hypothetical protein
MIENNPIVARHRPTVSSCNEFAEAPGMGVGLLASKGFMHNDAGRGVALIGDIYNVFNGNAVLQVNNNFTTWQQPQGIMQARFVKFSVQFDF